MNYCWCSFNKPSFVWLLKVSSLKIEIKQSYAIKKETKRKRLITFFYIFALCCIVDEYFWQVFFSFDQPKQDNIWSVRWHPFDQDNNLLFYIISNNQDTWLCKRKQNLLKVIFFVTLLATVWMLEKRLTFISISISSK